MGPIRRIHPKKQKAIAGERVRSEPQSAGVGTWIKAVLDGPKRKAESRRLVLNLSAVDLPAPGSCQYPVKQSVAEMSEPVDAPG